MRHALVVVACLLAVTFLGFVVYEVLGELERFLLRTTGIIMSRIISFFATLWAWAREKYNL